jgi:hypothetical protein
LSKNSDFNHLKIIFAQKVKIKSKKSAKAKIKVTCGDMLETNKTPKAMWQQLDASYWLKE